MGMFTVSFGDFEFFCDETTLKITSEENIKIFSSPISTPKVQSLGKMPRTVTGKSVYTTQNGLLRYATLSALVGTQNLLKTPFGEITARLYKVEISGDKDPNRIAFNFYFCEVL
jgi:hypothetical protein